MGSPSISKPLPTLEQLRSRLHLDLETGHLFWKERPVEEFSSVTVWKCWRAVCVGKRADNLASNGYHRIRWNTGERAEAYAAHRIIWKMVNGRDPNPEIDHIDRCRTNNHPSNLREATRGLNNTNRVVISRVHRSAGGAVGVYPTKSGKFRAQMQRRGRCFHLGVYSSAEQARAAVKKFHAAHSA